MDAEHYQIGSLVRVRGREWVVLPESRQEEDLLVLRPLGGTQDEITGIYLPLEAPESAEFPLPDPAKSISKEELALLAKNEARLIESMQADKLTQLLELIEKGDKLTAEPVEE